VQRCKDILAKIGWWLCRLGKCVLTVDGADIADILCSRSEPTSHGNSVVAFLKLGRGTFDRD
jgi:hypothetical protein